MAGANQMALNNFDPNAILARSQDPATRAIGAQRGGARPPLPKQGYQLGDGLVSMLSSGQHKGLGGLFSMLFGGNRGGQTSTPRSAPIPLPRTPPALSRAPAVAAFQQRGMTPSQAYAAANAAAASRQPMSAFERSQNRNAAAESEARSLNNFSG
jgi:hypothetical protein